MSNIFDLREHQNNLTTSCIHFQCIARIQYITL